MSMQDPISDMLTRIRNAYMASLDEVQIPSSTIKNNIANVLKNEGYINGYSEDGEGVRKTLTIQLKYYKEEPVIEGIKRISKPSCRIYCGAGDIPKVRNGLGTVIMSTPKGVVSGQSAKKDNVGGEILCYVW